MANPTPAHLKARLDKLTIEKAQDIQQKHGEIRFPKGHTVTVVEFSWGIEATCECGEVFTQPELLEKHLKSKKVPFKPKPHLTSRPLAGNEELQKLKDSLSPKKPVRKNQRKPQKGRRGAA